MLELFIMSILTQHIEDEKARHRSFLASEFSANGFLVSDRLGLSSAIIDELVETIFEPAFEGRRTSHGAIVCSHPLEENIGIFPYLTWIPGDSKKLNLYCDGVKTFRVICPGKSGHPVPRGVVSFSENFVLDELDLFTIRDDAVFNKGKQDHEDPLRRDIALIKKSPSGEITVLCEDGIAVHRDARLSFFRYQYHFKSILRSHIIERWGNLVWENQTIDSILRVAIHTIGAEAGVGGTLILLHPDDELEHSRFVNSSDSIEPLLGMNIAVREHQHLLAPLMRTTDGAVFIRSDGAILSARNWLVIPTHLMSEAESKSGTRHLTGKLFSKLIKGLVVVISSDGPVTTYSGGREVFRTCERR